jgi:hypothetical protein
MAQAQKKTVSDGVIDRRSEVEPSQRDKASAALFSIPFFIFNLIV